MIVKVSTYLLVGSKISATIPPSNTILSKKSKVQQSLVISNDAIGLADLPPNVPHITLILTDAFRALEDGVLDRIQMKAGDRGVENLTPSSSIVFRTKRYSGNVNLD